MKVQWRPEHENEIKINFKTRCLELLELGEILELIGEYVWNRLLAHWNSQMYCNKYATT